MKDPAGIVNLEELDHISSLSGAGDGDVDPQSSPVIATILRMFVKACRSYEVLQALTISM